MYRDNPNNVYMYVSIFECVKQYVDGVGGCSCHTNKRRFKGRFFNRSLKKANVMVKTARLGDTVSLSMYAIQDTPLGKD